MYSDVTSVLCGVGVVIPGEVFGALHDVKRERVDSGRNLLVSLTQRNSNASVKVEQSGRLRRTCC